MGDPNRDPEFDWIFGIPYRSLLHPVLRIDSFIKLNLSSLWYCGIDLEYKLIRSPLLRCI